MKTALKLVVFVLLFTLSACAQLGLTPAKTFEDKLAYAVGVHKAVLVATTQSLNAKSISSKDAVQVLKLADDSRLILDAAKQAGALGDMDGANAKLLLAQSALTALQAYLNERSK